jgi:hypothetical protein
MPTTHSTKASRPTSSSEARRTGLIVGLVVGILALLLLAYYLINRRRKQGVKAGTRVGSPTARVKRDQDLEVGIIQEPVPVYQKEPKEDERRLAIGRAVDGERRG